MPLIDLGKAFSLNFNDISDDRLNAKMWTTDTDTNLFNMPVKIPGQFMLPTTTGNGLTKNQPCFRSVDNANTIIPVGLKIHSHTSDTDTQGGSLVKVFRDNVRNIDFWFGNTFIKEDFYTNASGTGAAVATSTSGSTALINCDTGSATDGYANMRKLGLLLDFSNPSTFSIRFSLLMPNLTNYVMRCGVNSEMINDANDATTRSYGIEACSANANYQAWSCDGTTRSTTASAFAVANNDDDVWRAEHDPSGPSVTYTRNNDAGNQIVKTNHIPTSGTTNSISLFSAGIKSTLAATTKTLQYRGAVIYGWVGVGEWN